MTMSRERPPFVADERTQLVGWLDMQRALVRYKCEGLAEADEHRSVLSTSPLMTMPGLARHIGHLDTIRELLDGEKGYY